MNLCLDTAIHNFKWLKITWHNKIKITKNICRPYHRFEICFTLKTRHTSPEMKSNESVFRPRLCTYRLNWARRISWGWGDEWDDTDTGFEIQTLEVTETVHNTEFYEWMGKKHFCFFLNHQNEPRALAWKATVLNTTLCPPPYKSWRNTLRCHSGQHHCFRR